MSTTDTKPKPRKTAKADLSRCRRAWSWTRHNAPGSVCVCRRGVRLSPELSYEPGDLVDITEIGGQAAARRLFMSGYLALYVPA